jgi:2-polyprenyl-3-methyl-5-hydroxy-6-metoxy-1,4-benzoquinol methylase
VQFRAVQRRLEPEILDSLPPGHPDALKSRRDLRVINRVMGNARWFRSVLSGRVQPGERVLELGSGSGELARNLRRVAPLIDSIDRVPAPPDWSVSARWHQADIRDFGGWHDYPVVIGNLILHHFTDEALAALGAALRPHARLLVFNELTRKSFNRRVWDFATPLLGAHPVTQHDGSVSIAAGFLGDELPVALGLDPQSWRWRVTSSWLGAYRLIAERRP